MNAQESEINIRRRLVEDKLKTLGEWKTVRIYSLLYVY